MGAEMPTQTLLGFEIPRLIAHDIPRTLHATLPAALNEYFIGAGALALRHIDSAALLVDNAIFGEEAPVQVARPRALENVPAAPLDWRVLDVVGTPTRRRGGG